MQRFQLLKDDGIRKIHETSLKVMENTGILFSYAPAREILARHGAGVEGEHVFFPPAMVEEKIKTVPASFTLYARDPEKNVTIDTQRAVFVGPYGAPSVLCMDSGRREGTLADFINIVKLCHEMKNIDIQSHIPCEPCDTDPAIRHNIMTYNTLKYSDKPLMGSVLGYEAARQSIEMAAIVFGGMGVIREKPAITSLACTLTPLSYDDKMTGSIVAYAEAGQPQLISSLSMAGVTTPATIAGTVALQNAEILAGIVLAQCVNPGTPVVYSASSSNADMRYASLAIGSPENSMFSLVNGQLAKFYNMPCRMSGALTDSKTMDSQAAYESAMTLMTSLMGGGNFILHAAGIIDTYNCVSYEKLMIDNEVIGMIKRIAEGVEVNEDTLARDVINEIGPRGHFLVHEHTVEHFRDFYMPSLSYRNSVFQWETDGSVPIERRANEKWKKTLAEYVEPKLPADIDAALRKYIEV